MEIRVVRLSLDEIESRFRTSTPIEDLISELDSVYDSSLPNTIDRGRSAFLLGTFFEVRDPSRAQSYYDEARQIAEIRNNSFLMADCINLKANACMRSRDLRGWSRYADASLQLAIESGNFYRASTCYLHLGVAAAASDDYDTSISMLETALDIATQKKYLRLQARVYWKLAEVSLIAESVGKARAYSERAVAISLEGQNIDDILQSKIRLAPIEFESKHFEQVIALVADIRSRAPLTNHSVWSLSHTLLGNVHAAKSKLKLAETEFRAALKLADYPNCERVRSNVHVHLAGLYLRMKNKSAALKEALAALKDAEKAQDAFCRKEALRSIHDCYKALGKFKEAHRYLEKYNDLVAESDAALLKNRLEYHELRNEFEKEKLESAKKTKAADLLRLELHRKEQELTEKTRHLIKQTESLTQFRDDLRALIRRSPADDPLVHQIRERLQSLPESQLNWEDFDEQFNAVHPQFLHNLTKEHPTLTAMERKVCVLLRLKLMSTDIAKLLFLSERNIENHRYRIRKKLCLNSTKSLHEFLEKY
jgi:tetratricopeptide (TPR) repeat protein